jgi:hypothetical protein
MVEDGYKYTLDFLVNKISINLTGRKVKYSYVYNKIERSSTSNRIPSKFIPEVSTIEGEIIKFNGSGGVLLRNTLPYKVQWNFDYKTEFIEFLDENSKVIPLTMICKYCKKEEIILNPNKYLGYYDFSYIDMCEKCKKEKLETCPECNATLLKSNFETSSKGERLCKNCYRRKYFKCNGCKKEFYSEERAGSYNDRSYCQECWDLRFNYCEVCERTYYLEDLIFNSEFGVWHCSGCRPQIKIIKNYHYKPTKYKFLKEKFEIPLYMGLELEVEPFIFDDSLQKLAAAFKNFLKSEYLENFIYLKTDSSIRGFEIVTHPFTLKYSHEHINWNKILKWLIENNYTSYKNGRCGLHVHLDKDYFSEMDIIKMRTFFAMVPNKIFNFSMRGEQGTTYCLYESFDKKKFFNFSQNGRHCAFNINTNKNTVEIRVFRGTLNIKRFIASLQFCDAVGNFIKELGGGFFFSKLNSEKIMWETFLDWAKKKGNYNHFINYNNLITSGNITKEREI